LTAATLSLTASDYAQLGSDYAQPDDYLAKPYTQSLITDHFLPFIKTAAVFFE
jgi:hypothetical protein